MILVEFPEVYWILLILLQCYLAEWFNHWSKHENTAITSSTRAITFTTSKRTCSMRNILISSTIIRVTNIIYTYKETFCVCDGIKTLLINQKFYSIMLFHHSDAIANHMKCNMLIKSHLKGSSSSCHHCTSMCFTPCVHEWWICKSNAFHFSWKIFLFYKFTNLFFTEI